MKSMFQPEMSILAISTLFALAGLAYAALGSLRAIGISDTYMGVLLLVRGRAGDCLLYTSPSPRD